MGEASSRDAMLSGLQRYVLHGATVGLHECGTRIMNIERDETRFQKIR